jgi:hypothetical protein
MSAALADECEMRFIAPTAKEMARAADAAQRGFAEVYPASVSARARRLRRNWLAAGLLVGGAVFGLLAGFSVLAPARDTVAELSFGSLIGWLTILSILLAVRPMQAVGERACLALVLRRYGFGVVAIAFCVSWAFASIGLAGNGELGAPAQPAWRERLMTLIAIGTLGGAWGAAGTMLAQLIAEAGASHRELVGANFQEIVRTRILPRRVGSDLRAERRIGSVVAGMTRSIESAIECDDLEEMRQSVRFVTPVLRELVWRTPVEQLGWDYSSNNRRELTDAETGRGADQPVIVDIRLAAAVSRLASAQSLPPVPSLLLDLRHIWLSATFAAIRVGRPGIVAGSCAVAFTAYRDAHRATRQSICEHFVDAATEFMLVLRSDGADRGNPAFAACRRPVVALFAHLSRLAAQRDEWENFKHFAKPLVDGLGSRPGDMVAVRHRALCGYALANLAGWAAHEMQNDQKRTATAFRSLQTLFAEVHAEVDFDALFRDVHPDPDEWNLGTEYWCSPDLERRARFGGVAGGFVDGAFPVHGASVLKRLHDFGKQSGGTGATSVEEHHEYVSKVLATLAVTPT